MLFNSVSFLLFFPLCLVIYFILYKRKTYQNIFLLLSSYYFYACFEPRYLLLLLLITIISYCGGILIHKASDNRKKTNLIITILLIIAPLIFYKYLNFFNQMMFDLLSLLGISMKVNLIKLLLPVGISFYTFQAISYVVDVYKNKVDIEYKYLDYSLFLGFFPQIASGPIGRAPSLLPQIKTVRIFNYENLKKGFNFLIWGYFIKLVIADRGAIYADTVFSNYTAYSGSSLLLATFIYSIQIYCDFAGYSLMALGTAKIMGFDLINNFQRPYLAFSTSDFWRRWHISLSTWFRDYIYIPLGGNRVSKSRHKLNILITFLASGIWHGAAYNFIIWGGLHGVYQIIGKATEEKQNKVLSALRIKEDTFLFKLIHILITFLFIGYGWMIFRTNNIEDIWGITKGYFKSGPLYMHISTLVFFFLGFIILMAKNIKDEYFGKYKLMTTSEHIIIRYTCLLLLIIIILLTGVLDNSQFIYFAF